MRPARLLLCLAVTLLVLMGTVAGLVATPAGRSVAAALATRWVPGLTIGSVSGGWRSLEIRNLAYAGSGLDVAVGRIGLDLDWRRLFATRFRDVHVGCIALADARVEVTSPDSAEDRPLAEASGPVGPVDLKLPLSVHLDALELERVAVKTEGMDLHLESLQGGMVLSDGRADVPGLAFSGLDLAVSGMRATVSKADLAAAFDGRTVDVRRLALGAGGLDLTDLNASDAVPEAAVGENPPGFAEEAASVPRNTAVVAPDAWFRQAEALFEKPLLPPESLPAAPISGIGIGLRVEDLVLEDWRIEGIPGVAGLPGLEPLVIRRFGAALSIGLPDASGRPEERIGLSRLELDSSAAMLSARGEATLAGSWPLTLEVKVGTDARPWLERAGLRVADDVLDAAAAASSLELRLSGDVAGRLQLESRLTGLAELRLALETDPTQADPPVKFLLSSPEIVAPAVRPADAEELPETPGRYVLRDFALTLDGTPRRWRLALNGRPELSGGMADDLAARIRDLNGTQPSAKKVSVLPEGKVAGVFEAAASGTLGSADVPHMMLDTPFGRVEGTVSADWRRHLAWKGDVKLSGLDAGRWAKGLPLKLEASAAGEGVCRTDGILLLKKLRLDTEGSIAEAPLGLHAAFSGRNALSWELERLDVLLGRNTLRATGSVSDLRDLRLDLDIHAPGLLRTVPGLRGRAEGRVRLDGSLAHPKAFADLTASDIAFGEAFSLKRLRIDMDMRNAPLSAGGQSGRGTDASRKTSPPPGPRPPAEDASWDERLDFILSSLADGIVRGRLDFSAEGFSIGGSEAGNAGLKLTGDERNHRLDLVASSGFLSGRLTLSGDFDRESLDWKGRLLSSAVSTPAGEWRSVGAASLDWTAEAGRFRMEPLCWRHSDGKGEACLGEAGRPLVMTKGGASGDAHLVLRRLDASILQPWLRKRSDRVSGVLTGRVDVAWDLEKRSLPSVSMDLNGDGLSYSTRWEGVRLPVTLEKLRAHAMVSDGRAAVAWNIRPEGNGSVTGSIGVADPAGARRLEGGILVKDVTPALIRPFLSRGEKAEGALNARLKAGGTLAAPRLEGRLSIDDVVVAADFVPFEMEPSGLRLDFFGNRSVLSGEVRSKTGTVRLSGEGSWERLNDWKASVAVETESFHADVRSLARVDVKGRVEAQASPEKVRLKGEIEMPKSLVEVKDLPASAVQVSEDQVLLDADLVPLSARAESLPVESDVSVTLGDDVRVAAFGLRARLTGGVRFVMGRGRSGLLGQIDVAEGRFRAYGQDLVVQSGRILFSGPMTNPGLRIEAVRNPENTADDVTAGIRVTGTAEAPRVTLFSSPQLSEQETLSYLLRGEGLGSSEGSSSAMMTSMLIGIGTSQGGGILSDVGDAVGLRGLGVDTTGTGDEQKVVVSAYVLPGLQVKYSIGLFDSIATITLRYRLLPKLYLEAASGAEQALDLLYRFEW